MTVLHKFYCTKTLYPENNTKYEPVSKQKGTYHMNVKPSLKPACLAIQWGNLSVIIRALIYIQNVCVFASIESLLWCNCADTHADLSSRYPPMLFGL